MQKMETGCGFEQAVTVFRIHTLMKRSTLFVPTVLFQGLCFSGSGRNVLYTVHCFCPAFLMSNSPLLPKGSLLSFSLTSITTKMFLVTLLYHVFN